MKCLFSLPPAGFFGALFVFICAQLSRAGSAAWNLNPDTDFWTNTGALVIPRAFHTATLLPNGKVLVAGGYNGDFIPLPGPELYDPASGTWTSAGRLNLARYLHRATLLPFGKVLVEGGFNTNGWIAGADVYDLADGTWTVTARLTTGSSQHTATLLSDGKVLVAGGFKGNGHPEEPLRVEL